MKGSEAQKQRPCKLLWMLWFDWKSISNEGIYLCTFYREKLISFQPCLWTAISHPFSSFSVFAFIMQDWNSRSDYRDCAAVLAMSRKIVTQCCHQIMYIKILVSKKRKKNQRPWLSRIEYFENNKQNLSSHLKI